MTSNSISTFTPSIHFIAGTDETYSISKSGVITGYRRGVTIMKPSATMTVTLSVEGLRVVRYVAHLVLEAFVEIRPKGAKCWYLDGNFRNVHLANLRWTSGGRAPVGSKLFEALLPPREGG